MKNEAVKKLRAELDAAKQAKDQKAKAVAQAVYDALAGFCEQQEEFAQAVVQSGKTLSDVCAAAMKGVGSSISDLEVYRRAVSVYFPGAVVDCVMTVRMSQHEDAPSNPSRKRERADSQTSDVLSLDLLDLLGG